MVAATTGHVNVHEAGAIEFTGHKVLTLPHHDGKINADELDEYCSTFYADGNYTHMVFPGCVYISQATEYGTLYTLAELEAIRKVCTKYDMPLFIDGARLGYALTATGNDVTIEDIARLADVFYIGGTKVGAMFGEAVVFTHGNMPKHFVTIVKQHGALLAKGWLLGLQFDTLFTDGLYLRIARHANDAADRIRKVLVERGYTLTFDAPTNQIFVTLDNETSERLQRNVRLGFTEKADDTHTVMRICTSWATTDEQVDELVALLKRQSAKQGKPGNRSRLFTMYNDCIAIAAEHISDGYRRSPHVPSRRTYVRTIPPNNWFSYVRRRCRPTWRAAPDGRSTSRYDGPARPHRPRGTTISSSSANWPAALSDDEAITGTQTGGHAFDDTHRFEIGAGMSAFRWNPIEAGRDNSRPAIRCNLFLSGPVPAITNSMSCA